VVSTVWWWGGGGGREGPPAPTSWTSTSRSPPKTATTEGARRSNPPTRRPPCRTAPGRRWGYPHSAPCCPHGYNTLGCCLPFLKPHIGGDFLLFGAAFKFRGLQICHHCMLVRARVLGRLGAWWGWGATQAHGGPGPGAPAQDAGVDVRTWRGDKTAPRVMADHSLRRRRWYPRRHPFLPDFLPWTSQKIGLHARTFMTGHSMTEVVRCSEVSNVLFIFARVPTSQSINQKRPGCVF